MKRPGGFDKGPEEPQRSERPRRHDRQAKVPPGPAPEAPPSTTPVGTDVPTEATPNDADETLPLDSLPQSLPQSLPRDRARPVGGLTRASAALKRRGQRRPADAVKAAERRVRAAERQYKRSNRRETRRFTLVARRARRRILIVLGAVVALALFVAVCAYTPLMAVREVQVEGTSQVNVDDVKSALSRLEGVPLALVDENEVLRALESFPLIQRFGVERVPPHTLRVRIEERLPVIALETDGRFRHYDAAGVLLGESEERPEGVPLGSGAIRNSSSEPFRAASQIVRDMTPELRAQLVSVTAATGQDVAFVLTNGVEVFWGSVDETVRKSVILQTMLTSLEGREVVHIDVSSTSAPIFK